MQRMLAADIKISVDSEEETNKYVHGYLHREINRLVLVCASFVSKI